jgi:hypothetical protein
MYKLVQCIAFSIIIACVSAMHACTYMYVYAQVKIFPMCSKIDIEIDVTEIRTKMCHSTYL